jgi:uncharacterized protein YndB with AHSA1/START domain
MSRDIILGIEIHADAETVFRAITTRDGLASFWVPGVEGDPGTVGAETTFTFSGAPASLHMRIDRLDEPKSIEWACLGDFPMWKGTVVRWTLSPEPEHGGTRVLFRHDGFPDDHPDFEHGSIAHTWSTILDHLKELAETGTTKPPLT